MQAIVISHGHFDHTMRLLGLADRFGARKVPLMVHPDAYLERKTVAPNGEERRLPTPMRADFRRENMEVIEEEQALDASATSAARAVHRLTGVKVVQAAR
jgi:7,8-dihydropterin-6-yl-methyl-4-(beta-D-ribofuranosyl)aminobenzene 5'-phosphate synthase